MRTKPFWQLLIEGKRPVEAEVDFVRVLVKHLDHETVRALIDALERNDVILETFERGAHLDPDSEARRDRARLLRIGQLLQFANSTRDYLTEVGKA